MSTPSQSERLAKAVDTASTVADLEKTNSTESGAGETSGTDSAKKTESGPKSALAESEYGEPRGGLEWEMSVSVQTIYYMYVAGLRNDERFPSVRERRPAFVGINALSYYLTWRYFKTGKWGWLAVESAAVFALVFASYYMGGHPRKPAEELEFLFKGGR